MLTQEQKNSFETNGYLVLKHLIQDPLIQELRDEAERLVHAESPTVMRRTWHERALFRRPAFRKILEVPELIEAARDLLSDVQLLALDLLVIRPNGGSISWHRDVTFLCNKTLSINSGIYLQDMTAEAGPLRVWPGSHRRDDWNVVNNECPHEVKVSVPAGSAVLFDAALWHTGDRNTSNQNRLALFPYFGHYWIKRMDNYYTQPLPAQLLATKDPMQRQLLGLGLQPGVASYHGDDESYNRRGEPGIDFVAD